eukprot:364889-Chlamydomonas_euryale.AAC.1
MWLGTWLSSSTFHTCCPKSPVPPPLAPPHTNTHTYLAVEHERAAQLRFAHDVASHPPLHSPPPAKHTSSHLAVEHERAAQLHIPDPVDKHLKVLILGCLFIRDRNAQVVDVVAIGDELIKDLGRDGVGYVQGTFSGEAGEGIGEEPGQRPGERRTWAGAESANRDGVGRDIGWAGTEPCAMRLGRQEIDTRSERRSSGMRGREKRPAEGGGRKREQGSTEAGSDKRSTGAGKDSSEYEGRKRVTEFGCGKREQENTRGEESSGVRRPEERAADYDSWNREQGAGLVSGTPKERQRTTQHARCNQQPTVVLKCDDLGVRLSPCTLTTLSYPRHSPHQAPAQLPMYSCQPLTSRQLH